MKRASFRFQYVTFWFCAFGLMVFCSGCTTRPFKAASFPNQNDPALYARGYTSERIFNKDLYAPEWAFNHGDKNSPPKIGLALSGGGPRAADYSIGVLKGLYDQGILTNVDVISAVSGGSYALAWLLCQPYYHATLLNSNVNDTLNQMFQSDGRFLGYIRTNSSNQGFYSSLVLWALFHASSYGQWTSLDYYYSKDSRREQVLDNSGYMADYRILIQKIYESMPPLEDGLATTNLWDKHGIPNQGVNFPTMAKFALDNHLPDFIFNSTLYTRSTNRLQSATSLWQRNFQCTPFGFGSDSFGHKLWADLNCTNYYLDCFNLAPAIDGAVVCQHNMSDFKEFHRLLEFYYADLGYAIDVPTNQTGADVRQSIHLSDGGHSENLGLYALVQRRCSNIIVVDAEWEEKTNYVFEAYTNIQTVLSNEMGLTFTVPDIDNHKFTCANPVMRGSISGFTDTPTNSLNVYYIKLGLDASHLDNYPPSVVAIKKYQPKIKFGSEATVVRTFPQLDTFDVKYGTNVVAALTDLGNYVVTSSALTNFLKEVNTVADK